jgi:hypothetical protein
LEVKMPSIRHPVILILAATVAVCAACCGGTSGLACTEAMAGITICTVSTSGQTMCPSGSTEVPSCPAANVLGSCTISGSSNDGVAYFYGTASGLATNAQSLCEHIPGGTWTPG